MFKILCIQVETESQIISYGKHYISVIQPKNCNRGTTKTGDVKLLHSDSSIKNLQKADSPRKYEIEKNLNTSD